MNVLAHFQQVSFPTSITLAINEEPRIEIDFSKRVGDAIMPRWRSKDGREWFVLWPHRADA